MRVGNSVLKGCPLLNVQISVKGKSNKPDYFQLGSVDMGSLCLMSY